MLVFNVLLGIEYLREALIDPECNLMPLEVRQQCLAKFEPEIKDFWCQSKPKFRLVARALLEKLNGLKGRI